MTVSRFRFLFSCFLSCLFCTFVNFNCQILIFCILHIFATLISDVGCPTATNHLSCWFPFVRMIYAIAPAIHRSSYSVVLDLLFRATKVVLMCNLIVYLNNNLRDLSCHEIFKIWVVQVFHQFLMN